MVHRLYVWNALEKGELGAVMLAEFESRDRKGYDCVSLPPEVVRRIRGKTHEEIEWERFYGVQQRLASRPTS
jgi:hypothetical protein